MTLAAAVLQVAQLDPYQNPDLPFADRITSPSGKVVVEPCIIRSFAVCPICQARTNDGAVIVRHQDGRTVEFWPMLYHYVRANHPIPIGKDGTLNWEHADGGNMAAGEMHRPWPQMPGDRQAITLLPEIMQDA
ncbi:hypothetical protein BST81_23405 [Leptolyngbya sp. 'hensonii']|uniref:hypothetical protein n=1 Tax=Leptolyngbya sp. 'hensonii' TaxID=1922337 RepID=UPI0009640770|nr:hypothetical protein [Leptolyngbya sp. 'hensonii']OLP16008.1 hypothetical protein BST81_23405 [Leptolyngbya sp. 'hensonii']